MYDYDRSFDKKASKEGIDQLRQDIIRIDILLAEIDDAEMMAVPLDSIYHASETFLDNFIDLIGKSAVEKRIPNAFKNNETIEKRLKAESIYILTCMLSVNAYQREHSTVIEIVSRSLEHLVMDKKTMAKLTSAFKSIQKVTMGTTKLKGFKDVVDMYTTTISCLRVISETVKFALKNQKSAEGNTGISIGNMQLINAGNFDNDTVEKAAKLIKEVVTIMSSHGFARLLYGPVSLVQKLSKEADTLAFYNRSTDSVYIQSLAVTSGQLKPHTLTHELGHRLLNKENHKVEAEEMYNVLRRTQQEHYSEEFITQLQAKYLITGTSFKVKLTKYMLNSNAIRFAKGRYIVEVVKHTAKKATINHIALSDFMKLAYGKSISEQNLAPCFVSNYAETNAQENFCEMFAHYCLNILNPSNKKLFEEHMKAIF